MNILRHSIFVLVILQYLLLQNMGTLGYVLCANEQGHIILEIYTTSCECQMDNHYSSQLPTDPVMISFWANSQCTDLPLLDKNQPAILPVQPIPIIDVTFSPMEYLPFPNLSDKPCLAGGLDPPPENILIQLKHLNSVILLI